MEINIEKHAKGLQCMYCIYFDSGYYYIGVTNCFKKRSALHEVNIKWHPYIFGAGVTHYPTKCNIFPFHFFHDYQGLFKLERDFLIQNSHDPYLLNKNKSICKLVKVKENLCKRINQVKK